MKIDKFNDKSEWLAARTGRITGNRLKSIIVKKGNGKKKGYYELIAERLAVTEEDFDGYIPNETPMERGTRLESYAIDRFMHETGKKVSTELVIWSREDNDNIACSPDGTVEGEKAACEAKCLNSASHIEAFLTQEIPDEYKEQAVQYFIVNQELKKLYFIFYDPRIVVKDFFFITINREDVEAEIDSYLSYQIIILQEVEEIVKNMTSF